MLRKRSNLLSIFLVISITASAAIGVFVYTRTSPSEKLTKLHQILSQRYPDVSHISAEVLATLPLNDVILFDVREQAEFDVGHLQSAIHVSPDINPADFMQTYGDQLNGRKVVFYCSVGERSSKLAEAVLELSEDPDIDVVNLEKGIFNWHNQERQVFDADGKTEKIHPFNKFWGSYLRRRDQLQLN